MLKKKNPELPFSKRGLAPLLMLVFCVFIPATGQAQESAVLLSKGSGLYFDTFLSFQKTLGRPVAAFDLTKDKPSLPKGLKAAVAFGSMAAAFEYPPKAKVIYALAPGFAPKSSDGRFTGISAMPEPAQAVSAYRELQPGLKRLAVFFKKGSSGRYLAELADAARPHSVEIILVGLGGPAEFPDKLRELAGKIDAFWLLPEPSLINRTSLMILGEFSCSNKIPFYAPSGGLSELEAAAAFAPTFAEAGATAAAALEKALAGGQLPETVYVPISELTVNSAFVKKCGLPVVLPAAGEAR